MGAAPHEAKGDVVHERECAARPEPPDRRAERARRVFEVVHAAQREHVVERAELLADLLRAADHELRERMARREHGEPLRIGIHADVADVPFRRAACERVEVRPLAATEIQHAPRETCEHLQHRAIVSREDVDGHGLPCAGATWPLGASLALGRGAELP